MTQYFETADKTATPFILLFVYDSLMTDLNENILFNSDQVFVLFDSHASRYEYVRDLTLASKPTIRARIPGNGANYSAISEHMADCECVGRERPIHFAS